MQNNNLVVIILISCALGVIINAAFIGFSNIEVMLLPIAPYLIVIVAALIFKKGYLPILIGVLLMLLVDAWLFIESILEVQTSITLALSLLSTLKIIVLFPIGLLIGYLIQRMCRGQTTV